MMKLATVFLVIVLCAVSSVKADYSVWDKGAWPKSWPAELELLRKQARTLEGPLILFRHYLITFTDRDVFEAAWPHLLKVKTKGAPIFLVRGPKTDFFAVKPAGVYIHAPPSDSGQPEAPVKSNSPRERWMWTTYIELAVDGDIVDLNRIPLPADTPIIDERFKEDKPVSKDLGKITPPGGVPLNIGRPGDEIKADGLKKAAKRLESTPQVEFDKWLFELERIMDSKLDGDLARQACCTHFVIRMSVAFDDLQWNFAKANKFFLRAQSLPASEAKAWKEVFETLLKKEIGQTAKTNLDGGPSYAVPLVLISVDALHEQEKYSSERGKKYLARLKQLTAEDVSLWFDKVDEFGGTKLDAAVNIIMLDEYFDQESFQRDRFQSDIQARKKQDKPK